MTTTPHQLSTGSFTQDWSNIGQITTNDDWSGVPSIVGYLGDDASTTTAGLDPQARTSDFTTVDVVANQTNPSITNGGVAEFHLTNPTIALQGSGGSDFPNIVLYLDSTGRTGITVSYNIRDIDGSADNTNQQVALQYRTDPAGAWINVPAAYVADATTGPSLATLVTPVSATLPSGADNQPNLQVRIITSNAPSNDEWVGIDDIVVSSTAAGPVVPALSIDNVTAVETDSGTVEYTFTVSLSSPAGADGVTFDIATADGTAQDGSPATEDADYVAKLLTTQTILQGSSTYTFTVVVNGDSAIEPDETFFVNVTNVTGATVTDAQGQGTIQNNDVPPTPAASVADATIVEGQSGVTYLSFTVTLSFAPTDPVTIDYATANGTAAAGSDYLAVSGQLSFAAGETTKTVSVPIVGDTVPEANETFTLTLSNPTGATIADNSATGTITSDDGSAYFSLASGNFSETWTDIGRITTNDNWSGVPFIVGYLGDIDSGQPTGNDPRTVTGASLGAVDVIANQTNPATNTSGGVAEFHIADPTIALQGSGTADAPSIVLYMDASGRTDIRVQARLRDVDASADNAVQPIAVQYRTDPNGAWTNAPGGYFSDVTTAGSATQETLLDIVLPADANNASTLQIRILTTNASGSDEWVGIDDIMVSSNQGAPSYSVSDAAAFEGTGGTTPFTFTVTRAGDAAATGTVDYELSFVGGGFSASASDIASPLSGTVSFAAGETTKTVTIDVAADAIPEADEGFLVLLSNPSAGSVGDGIGNGTIVNDDGAPPFVTVADVTQAEGNDGSSLFTFTVTRTGGTGGFTVDYATTATGTATAGEDYEPASGTLTFQAGENSRTFTVEVTGDLQGELAETFGVSLSNPTGNAVIADPTAIGTIQNDDLLFIHQIQGSAYYSPILASEGTTSFDTASQTTVIVRAVVTAVDNQGTRQGFYITEEQADWDGSLLTSEGIFVMTRDDDGNGVELATAIAGLAVGDLVTVSAKVMEYQAFQSMPRTMLVNPSSITINSSGNQVPRLVLDGLDIKIPNSILTLVTPDYTDSADNAGDTFDASLYALSFWETVEGMLVTVPDMVVADGFISTSNSQPIFQAYSTAHADADQINARGGYTVAGDPPNSPPDTPEDDQDGTIAGGRHLHDGDINPDIIEIDFSGFAMPAPAGLINQLSMGDKLGAITGIVEFDFTDRKIFVTDYDGTQFVNTQPARETTSLGNDGRSLTVATFNVENLDPGDGQARFDAIAEAIATNLNAPDILIIEEIQDNNGTAAGTADASVTWQMLVDAVNARVPGARYQWVDQEPVNNAEGGAGNGNIRVGFLYDTNRVQLGDLAADAPIEQRRQFTDRIGDGVRDLNDRIAFSDNMVAGEINTADWTNTRKSLLGQFTFNGNTVFIIGNHFTAKGGSGEFWQVNQDIAAGEPENSGFDRRVQQAEDVYHVMNLIESSATSTGVISGGDYNDFYFYRPLEVATGYVETDGTPRVGGGRFDNLTLKLSEAERYTYTFDGRSQALDHLVASQGLAADASIDVVHINTGYNALGTGADTSPRLSDHDPALASFNYRGFGERLSGTSGSDTLEGFGGDDRLQGLAGADTIDGGEGSDTAIYTDEAPNGVVLNLSTFFITVPDRPGATRQVAPNEALDGFDNYDTLVSIENAITGDKDDRLYGSDGANRFETGGGNDLLRGGGGADVMIGGTGNDTYGVDDAGDQVTENANEGTDTVSTSLAAYTLGAHVENLFSEGFLLLARDYRANALSNDVRGGLANDIFRLQDGGDDTVRGDNGRDIFYFGTAFTAADSADGGEGSDILILQGDYSGGVTLGGGTASDGRIGQVLSVDTLLLYSGSNTSYGDMSGAAYSYTVTSRDENVASGGQMRVNGFGLLEGENLTFIGSAETDGTFLMLGGRGTDTLVGGARRDIFVFGHDGRFAAGDTVDGGDGVDIVYLRGDYQLDFVALGGNEATFASVESIGLTSFADTSYAGGGDGEFDYVIVWNDAMLFEARTISINGSRLGAGETMTFDGSDETDGSFRIFGGTDADVLRGGDGGDLINGGLGADTMEGNGGDDIFRYQGADESTSAGRDSIQDFSLGDIVDLARIDTDAATAGDQAFTFIGQAAFSGTKGELRYQNEAGNIWKVQGDVDGNGVADLEFLLIVADGDPITAADFML